MAISVRRQKDDRLDPVPAAGLGAVERAVGSNQKAVGHGQISTDAPRCRRHAETDRDDSVWTAFVWSREGLDGGSQGLRDARGAG